MTDAELQAAWLANHRWDSFDWMWLAFFGGLTLFFTVVAVIECMRFFKKGPWW